VLLADSPYLSPQEAAYCAVDATDKALGAVIAKLVLLAMEQEQLHQDLNDADDDLAEAIEWRLKQLHNEERSLHRIESGLQSRLRSGQ